MYRSSPGASIAASPTEVDPAMNQNTIPVRACLAAFALHALAGAAQAAASDNLIVNGGAESGLCAGDWNAVKTVPGWQVLLGQPTQVCHSIASFGEPASPAPGNAFLADGPYGDAAMKQVIDVSSAAKAIDKGGVTFKLKGWLGGYGAYTGQAVVTANFLDAAGHPLGTPGKLAGATASARGLASKFLAESDSGSVPAGTRQVDVQVQFIDTAPSYNVGYVDNLSFTLSTPVPAPALVAPPSTVPAFDHVFVVMMENTDFAQVIGSSHAPFINSLAQRGTLLANYNGAYHPSDENYLAIAGGDTFVSGAIYFPNIKVAAPHLGDELEAVGKTWKAYEQGMGTPCHTKNDVDSYYEPDDAPFINFTDISATPRAAPRTCSTRRSSPPTSRAPRRRRTSRGSPPTTTTTARPPATARPTAWACRTAGCSRPCSRSSPRPRGRNSARCSSSPGTSRRPARTTTSRPSSTARPAPPAPAR